MLFVFRMAAHRRSSSGTGGGLEREGDGASCVFAGAALRSFSGASRASGIPGDRERAGVDMDDGSEAGDAAASGGDGFD